MKYIKEIIQNQVGQEVWVEHGCIGTEYSEVLIVDNGKIVRIGQFIYRAYREGLGNKVLWTALGVECRKYMNGERQEMPSMYFTAPYTLSVV